MYEINEISMVTDDNIELTAYKRDVVDCNILEVVAGTTGYKGGDSGHGGRTYFSIIDSGCTDIHVRAIGIDGHTGLEVTLGGDSELTTIITALKFITKVLEDGAKGVQD